MNKKINIVHLFPDMLNLYGDKGNIMALKKRLEWRGIEVEVFEHTDREREIDFQNADIIFLGGGSDKEQEVVLGILMPQKERFSEFVESGGTVVATCGGFEMIAKSSGGIEGLGIIDAYAEGSDKRLISNVILESDLFEQKITGFENHSGRMNIGSLKPLGKVLLGNGNDGVSGFEGAVYKNVVATYLHGPLLIKNPMLCDYILSGAMKNKYDDFSGFEMLDDKIEDAANESVVKRFLVQK